MLRTAYRVENEPTQFTNIVFKGVQGYHFENDAFGNVISGLEPIPLEPFLTENGAEISESCRMARSPGPWAANLGTAVGYLRRLPPR
jgi:hypothetical protein